MTSPETNPPDPDAAALALAQRYGRAPRSRRRRAFGIAATASALVAAGVAWLVWSGILGTPTEMEVLDTGHVIVSDRETEVRWQLTVTPETPVSCAVHALNGAFGIVGWLVVDLPPSPQRTRDFSQIIRTSEEAVTGLIYRCWLT